IDASRTSKLQASSLDTLRDFAAMAGGLAFYNTNDLAGSFRKAADDASSYYVLRYYLDTHNDKPGWRSLKVKVDKPGGEICARNGFFVTNATMNPKLGVTYHNTMVLSPGQYTVKMVVRDNLSGKVGSLSAPLTVN